MKRVNASIPHWNDNRWLYQTKIEGLRQSFVSAKPGKAGYIECMRKKTLFEAGMASSTDLSLEKAWDNYLIDLAARKGIDSNSYAHAEQIGRVNLLTSKMKIKHMSQISDQDWQDIINNLKPVQEEKRAYSKKTISNIRGEIMLFCKYARKGRLIEHKPEDLEIPRRAEYIGKKILQPAKLIEFLSDTDMADNYQYIHAWQLMVVTGMRPGESYGLKKSDIENDMIDIKRSISSKNIITKGKNKNAIRTMYQSEIAKIIIDRQQEKKKRLKIISPWLFCKPTGDQPNTETASNEWNRYRQCHGMDGIAVYSMRHTFVTFMDKKMDKKKIKEVVGHSESMDTERYVHEMDGDKLIEKESIDKAFDDIVKILS